MPARDDEVEYVVHWMRFLRRLEKRLPPELNRGDVLVDDAEAEFEFPPDTPVREALSMRGTSKRSLFPRR